MLTEDLRVMAGAWESGPLGVWLRALPRILTQGRFRTIVYFRASGWCHRHRLTPLAAWLQSRGQRATGAELHPAARFGPRLTIQHGGGIVVGHQVEAGSDVVLYQGVTLGHGHEGKGQPRLGDRVHVFAGATLLGPISVGDDAQIGAHALVLADVPAGAVVKGTWTRSSSGLARATTSRPT